MFPSPMMELLRLKPSVIAEGFIVGSRNKKFNKKCRIHLYITGTVLTI